MNEVHKLAGQHEKKAKSDMKLWYDKAARARSFTVGEQVLVLLPARKNKLLAEWQGPYVITKKITDVTYEVCMSDRKKKRRIFHINMLAQWHNPTAECLMVEQAELDDGTADDIVTWTNGAEGDVIINPDLSVQQQADIQNIISRFKTVFQDEPGRTETTSIEIVTGDASPVHLPPYQLPKSRHETVRGEIKQLLQAGIIKPSTSPWASPIVLVPKRDGTLRLCVDYRCLNKVTRPDPFPMPRIDDLLDGLGSAEYITTLDLTKGYWQVPVHPNSQQKTAFVTPFGKYEFLTMPFGLVGAPATFQRLMNEILADISTFTAAYLDDTVIFSRSWPEHLNHITEVLQRLKQHGLTVKLGKCQLGMNECSFLGHRVGKGQIRPLEGKIRAVQQFAQPQKKKDVRAFLGLAGYYRRFIPNFAEISAPLTNLTKKDLPDKVKWTTAAETAFQQVKGILASDLVLCSPDPDKVFILQTDASSVGIAAVLSQQDDQQVERPVAYFSRQLLPRETRYATAEQECLAVVEAVKHFRVYLTGVPFRVQTDHRCLMYLDKLKDESSRLTRWALTLQPYNFVVTHRPGRLNANADGLSRQAWEMNEAPYQQQQFFGGRVECQGVTNKHTSLTDS